MGAALPGAWSHSGERKSLPTFAGLFGAARPRNESLSEASQSLEGAFSALLFTRCVCLPAGGGGAGAAARRGRGAHAAAERRGGAPPGTLRRERAGAGARRGPAGAPACSLPLRAFIYDAKRFFLLGFGKQRTRSWCVHHTAMPKLRIVRLGFGTARQKRVLERWTNPKPLQPIWDRAAI